MSYVHSISVGVPQGCVMSHVLFIVYVKLTALVQWLFHKDALCLIFFLLCIKNDCIGPKKNTDH